MNVPIDNEKMGGPIDQGAPPLFPWPPSAMGWASGPWVQHWQQGAVPLVAARGAHGRGTPKEGRGEAADRSGPALEFVSMTAGPT